VTPERWRQINKILDAAWERTAKERSAFLDEVCSGDTGLRAKVEALLAADENPEGFWAAPRAGLAEIRQAAFARAGDDGSNDLTETSDIAGTRVGRYTIQGLIGKGGMGAVYRAVREDDFRMEVAVKLLNRGTDTDASMARFRVERQVLAGLQHPNIARLLDGGTTDAGLPYLVMEYVDGMPLLEYAAPLPVRSWLALFRRVCDAVQYAHEHLIVHRDIKPANILVTSDGIPKLLDFGIAKLLDSTSEDNAALTSTGMRPMTIGYASPEQIRGEPVTTSTDVYSLGAVLYELLTGRRAPPLEIPTKPSALVKGLDADLDNIVLMALRPEPERRYESVRGLSEDLDRFLRDLPIHARRESPIYRGRKYLKRNRVAVWTGVFSVVIALAFSVGLSRFAAMKDSPGSGKARNTPGAGLTLRRWDQLRFETIAALGDPAPGGGTFTKDFEPWSLNRRGDVAFVAETSAGNSEGVFLLSKTRGLVALPFARVSQLAQSGGTLDGGVLGYASINDVGDVAFVFGLKPFTPASLKGFAKAGLYQYAASDGALRAVVVPGVTPAPGFGIFQSTSQHASLNNSGDIAFTGVVPTTAGLRFTPGLGAGVFVVQHDGRILSIAAPGDAAPGGGKFDFAQNPWINDRGDVAFGAHIAGEECVPIATVGPACAESVYLKSAASGAIQSIAHAGEQAVGDGLYRWAWGPVLNARGDVVYMGELHAMAGQPQHRGIYLRSASGTVPIALPGDAMPDGRKIVTVNPASMPGNYSVNNVGEVSFNASLENGESGLYVHSQGALHLVAGTNSTIPGVGTIVSVTNLIVGGGILNDSGQVLFGATLTGGSGVLLLATPSVHPSGSSR